MIIFIYLLRFNTMYDVPFSSPTTLSLYRFRLNVTHFSFPSGDPFTTHSTLDFLLTLSLLFRKGSLPLLYVVPENSPFLFPTGPFTICLKTNKQRNKTHYPSHHILLRPLYLTLRFVICFSDNTTITISCPLFTVTVTSILFNSIYSI